MGCFVCKKCNCIDNTALGHYWCRRIVDNYNWQDLEEYKGEALCMECAPKYFSDGTKTGFGNWHNLFDRINFDNLTEKEKQQLL